MPTLKPVPREADRNQIEAGLQILRGRPLTNERRLRQALAEIYAAMVEIAPPEKVSGLLKRQKILLEIIKETIDETGQAPTCEEAGRQMGIAKSNVSRMLKQLEDRGFIRRRPRGWRAIELIKRQD